MQGIDVIHMGDRGRVVIPLAVRERQHWDQGVPLHVIEAEGGVVLVTREQLKALIKEQLGGRDLVAELVQERRAAAAAEAGS